MSANAFKAFTGRSHGTDSPMALISRSTRIVALLLPGSGPSHAESLLTHRCARPSQRSWSSIGRPSRLRGGCDVGGRDMRGGICVLRESMKRPTSARSGRSPRRRCALAGLIGIQGAVDAPVMGAQANDIHAFNS